MDCSKKMLLAPAMSELHHRGALGVMVCVRRSIP